MEFRAFRENELKMDIMQFALFLEESEDNVLLWESTNEPPMEILQKLAKKTGVSFLELIKYKSENSNITVDNSNPNKFYVEKMDGRNISDYLDHILSMKRYENNKHLECLRYLKSELDDFSKIGNDEDDVLEEQKKLMEAIEEFIIDYIDKYKYVVDRNIEVMNNKKEYKELMRRVSLNEPDRISTAKKYEAKILQRIDDLKEQFPKKYNEIFEEVFSQGFIVDYIDSNNFKNTKTDGLKIDQGIVEHFIDSVVIAKNNDFDDFNQQIREYLNSMDCKIDEPFQEMSIEKRFNWDYVYDNSREELIDRLNEELSDDEEIESDSNDKKIGLKDIGRRAILAINLPNPFFWMGLGIMTVKSNITWKKEFAKEMSSIYGGEWKSDILSTILNGFDDEKFIFEQTSDIVKGHWENYMNIYNNLLQMSDEEIIHDNREIDDTLAILQEIADTMGFEEKEDEE